MKTQRYLIQITNSEPHKVNWSEDIKEELGYAFRNSIIKVIKIKEHLRLMKGGQKKHGKK